MWKELTETSGRQFFLMSKGKVEDESGINVEAFFNRGRQEKVKLIQLKTSSVHQRDEDLIV